MLSQESLQAPLTRDLSGYFTLFGFLRGQTLDELETRIGFRAGRLTDKGAWIYRFLRIPKDTEFDVRGTSIWTDERWRDDVAPQRAADIASVALYHKNTRVPSFDQIQRRNARESMGLAGANAPVKVYPVDWQPIDDTADGFRHGSGISQYRLNEGVIIQGKWIATLAPGDSVPWQIP